MTDIQDTADYYPLYTGKRPYCLIFG